MRKGEVFGMFSRLKMLRKRIVEHSFALGGDDIEVDHAVILPIIAVMRRFLNGSLKHGEIGGRHSFPRFPLLLDIFEHRGCKSEVSRQGSLFLGAHIALNDIVMHLWWQLQCVDVLVVSGLSSIKSPEAAVFIMIGFHQVVGDHTGARFSLSVFGRNSLPAFSLASS